jgi:hypothetical protein
MPEITFTPIITAAGFAAALAAETGGFKVNITHVGAGSTGQTVAVNASGLATTTALATERDRVVKRSAIETAPGQTDLSFVIDSANEYYVREVGFFLADGTLFAIASHATTALMWKSAQTQALIAFELVLQAVNPAAVTIISAGPPLELLLTNERARLTALEAIAANTPVYFDHAVLKLQTDALIIDRPLAQCKQLRDLERAA